MSTNLASLSLVLGLALLSPLSAQEAGKKSYVFRGTVEQVNTETKKVTVSNEPVEGWMGARGRAERSLQRAFGMSFRRDYHVGHSAPLGLLEFVVVRVEISPHVRIRDFGRTGRLLPHVPQELVL